jgi:gamma-glutamyltranspeptidase/glutathione hydrolase
MSRKKVEFETSDQDLSRQRAPWLQRIAASPNGMVTTANYNATDAAVRVLEAGGHAVDAAVAAAFALGVCEPAASGLGGQTMILYHQRQSRKTIALDGSSRAPHRVEPGSMIKRELLRGHQATTVPSTPAVLAYILKNYGTKKISEVLEPAIDLAEKGYKVTELQNALSKREIKHLRSGSCGKFFLKNNKVYPVGSLFRQPVLARTLKRIADKGVEDFYQGEIAQLIHSDMEANNGLVHADDLAQIPWPIERQPLSCRYHGLRVHTFGEPGSGRTLVQMLKVAEKFDEDSLNPDTPEGALLLSEIIRQANIDRLDRPFEPNFYPQVQGKKMLSEEYASEVAEEIEARMEGHGDTTHLSVMDRNGNVVVLTQSIERVYGSFEASPALGFLYNNYMSAFEYEDINHPYYLRPTASPWASVAPTIVFKGAHPWLAIGSPGSERITSAIFQVLLRLRKQSPYDAVSAPRLHCSINNRVSMEASRMRDDIPPFMEKHGFSVDLRDPYSFFLGCIQLVMNVKEEFIGVADPRRDGSARGPKE